MYYWRNPRWARLGDLNYNSDIEPANPKDYKIIDRKIHPLYKKPINYNDIALFKLDQDVIFSAYVRPICLNSDPLLNPEKVVASGWGNVDIGKYDYFPPLSKYVGHFFFNFKTLKAIRCIYQVIYPSFSIIHIFYFHHFQAFQIFIHFTKTYQ